MAKGDEAELDRMLEANQTPRTRIGNLPEDDPAVLAAAAELPEPEPAPEPPAPEPTPPPEPADAKPDDRIAALERELLFLRAAQAAPPAPSAPPPPEPQLPFQG